MAKVVIFHHNDLDGWVSATIVLKKLFLTKEISSFDDVILQERQYGEDIKLSDFENKKIYIVDFSFSPQQMLGLDEGASEVIWIDHHASAWGMITLPYKRTSSYINSSKSASLITWNVLFPGEEPPALVKLTNDHDLWLEKYEDSHAINEIFKIKYNSPEKIYNDGLLDEFKYNQFTKLYQLAQEGHIIVKDKQNRVNHVIENGVWGTLGSHQAYYVNSPSDISFIGSTVCKKHPDKEFIVVIYSHRPNGEAQVSLRSTTIDCAEIATTYGGGGHFGASSFRMKVVKNAIIDRMGERFGRYETRKERRKAAQGSQEI